ncbi:MAG: MGDG synthase family glycosyltransferase [Acidimicrobiia bacterium]
MQTAQRQLTAEAAAAAPPGRRRVLIVSASMGAGHDGAARELKGRLEALGDDVGIVDFLELPYLRFGAFMRWSYEAQLRLVPWSYELMYRMWYLVPCMWYPLAWFDTFVSRRRLRKTIDAMDPDVVVSTYPLASLVLGNLRRKKWLRVPAITYVTDFGVHPLWTHPGIDLTLTVSPRSAVVARERTGRPVEAPGPLVSARFRAELPDRATARAKFGLGDDERVALVVAGSWGVGDVVRTVEVLASSDRFHVVTVCGRDDKLRARLDAARLGTVIGWTDDMPTLMAACDALVENAGGLSCMEAYAARLPVVSFLPIAGHGRENAQWMSEYGSNRYAQTDDELFAALEELTVPGGARDRQIARARALFAGDAARAIDGAARRGTERPVVVPVKVPHIRRRVTGATAAAIMVYGGLTLGAQAVAGFGVGVAVAPKDAHDHVYLGVRLAADDLADPAVIDQMRTMDVTAIVDAHTAQSAPGGLRELAEAGVDIGNGGWGSGHGASLRWRRAQADVAKSAVVLRREAGVQPTEFAPGRRFDAFDQLWCRRRHQRLVAANDVFDPDTLPVELHGRRVYVLEGRDHDPAALVAALDRLDQRLDAEGLRPAPLAELT